MIAVALGLLGLVVMIATGVAASSTGGDHLTFLGVQVQTTTAQVFMTGAIFGWVFVIALWLLRRGIHRSGERCAQLAARRGRRASAWLGFGEAGVEGDGDGWGDWDEWSGWGREPELRGGRRGWADPRDAQTSGIQFRTTAPIDARGAQNGSGGWGDAHGTTADGTWPRRHPISGVQPDRVVGRSEALGRADARNQGEARGTEAGGTGSRLASSFDAGGTRPERIVGRAGAARYARGAPGRADAGGDQAHRAGAGAAEQPGAVGGGHAVGPGAGGLPGVGVSGGAQSGEVGGDSGAVAGEDRGSEGDGRCGEGRQ